MAYIDLATLKLELGINATDTTRDVLLTMALSAAEKSINEKTGRRFDQVTPAVAREFRVRGRIVPDCDGELLLVDDIASETGLVVEATVDGQTWLTIPAADYELEPDNALERGRPVTGIRYVNNCWRQFRRARVTAVWGWPQVPDDIKQATLLQAMRLYRRKDSPEGVAGSADWGLVRLPNLDPDVRALIAPYRMEAFGD